jgi:hypothetical protein
VLNVAMEQAKGFTSAQRASLDERTHDQDRTLSAMHHLEAALSAAAPGREARWHESVLAGLVALDDATRSEFDNAKSPDSLLSDVKRSQPRLRTRVRGLRSQYEQMRQAIALLRQELTEASDDEDSVDFAEIRQRLSWMLTALRHQRARESDLIYDAYRDAFDVELERDRP